MSDDIFVAEFQVEILSAEESKDGKTGTVKAIVSTTNHAYQMGYMTKHKMMPGAHEKAVARTPVSASFFQHNWSWSEQPPVGATTWSVDNGKLIASTAYFLDTDAGRAVYNANKAKALKEWSIGYRILAHDLYVDEKTSWETFEISDYELLENSSVVKGANDQTRTLSVASASKKELAEMVTGLEARLAAVEKELSEGMFGLSEAEQRVTELEDKLGSIEPVEGKAVFKTTSFKALEGRVDLLELQLPAAIADLVGIRSKTAEANKELIEHVASLSDRVGVLEGPSAIEPIEGEVEIPFEEDKLARLERIMTEGLAEGEEIDPPAVAEDKAVEESSEPAGVDGGSEGDDVTATDVPEVPDSSSEDALAEEEVPIEDELTSLSRVLPNWNRGVARAEMSAMFED